MPDLDVVVIGGGPAAAALVHELDRGGHRGGVAVVAEEDRLPYDRTVVSKGLLLAGDEPPTLFEEVWGDVEVHRGVAADGIDLGARRVALADGRALGYDRLVLATGAAPRVPPIDGLDLPGVSLLRGAGDGTALHGALVSGRRLVVVGAGVIGLEVAAAARARGVDVVVLELAVTPMGRVLPPAVVAPLLDRHRAEGVDLRMGVRPTSVAAVDGALAVTCADGTTATGDRVLVATGIAPRTALAEAAGLEVADGVVVDELLTTSDARVMAIGDVAALRTGDGRVSRTEAYTPAMSMGQHAARTILGQPAPFTEVPWSWSDQHDLSVQAAGWPDRAVRWVVRGTADDLEAGLHAFGVDDDGVVVAAAGVSRGRAVGRVVRGAQRLIAAGVAVADGQLADPDVDVRRLARG
ncbi:NAD(P)/FAD-dependent oxidoreductase [Euzebya sp.]|uniref:NAD(P)/FAD-dependent oxidoreductase n=1 Tax=Euzebya sp. TaxID=1971409 RepID=UPI003514FFC3